jgi:hypothetical protein
LVFIREQLIPTFTMGSGHIVPCWLPVRWAVFFSSSIFSRGFSRSQAQFLVGSCTLRWLRWEGQAFSNDALTFWENGC